MSKIDMNENNAHALTFLESPCLSCQKQLMSIYRNLICLIGICAVQQSTKSNKEIQNWIIFWYFLSRILLLLCFLHCTGILDLPWDVLHIVLVVLSSFLFFPQVNMSYFLLIEWQVLYTISFEKPWSIIMVSYLLQFAAPWGCRLILEL